MKTEQEGNIARAINSPKRTLQFRFFISEFLLCAFWRVRSFIQNIFGMINGHGDNVAPPRDAPEKTYEVRQVPLSAARV